MAGRSHTVVSERAGNTPHDIQPSIEVDLTSAAAAPTTASPPPPATTTGDSLPAVPNQDDASGSSTPSSPTDPVGSAIDDLNLSMRLSDLDLDGSDPNDAGSSSTPSGTVGIDDVPSDDSDVLTLSNIATKDYLETTRRTMLENTKGPLSREVINVVFDFFVGEECTFTVGVLRQYMQKRNIRIGEGTIRNVIDMLVENNVIERGPRGKDGFRFSSSSVN